MIDALINGLADANESRQSQTWVILVLAAQLFVRIGCFTTSVQLLASSSSSWMDELLVDFCGLLSVSLIGLILALFLRVYRVMLSSYTSKYPDVLTYWDDPYYCALLLAHTIASMAFYYWSVVSGHRMGGMPSQSQRRGAARRVQDAPAGRAVPQG